MFWVLYFSCILLMLCEKRVSCILILLWGAHAFNYALWTFGKLIYYSLFDVKWSILVKEIKLTYLSLNYHFGNWFLCEKPPHTNFPLFSIIYWENQGHVWRVLGGFETFPILCLKIVWDPTFMDLVFPLL